MRFFFTKLRILNEKGPRSDRERFAFQSTEVISMATVVTLSYLIEQNPFLFRFFAPSFSQVLPLDGIKSGKFSRIIAQNSGF